MSYDLKLLKGDLVLNNSGSLRIVERNSKLRQDILKILLTDIGENKYHQYYGCLAGRLDIGNILDQDFFKTRLEDSVKSAIKNLMILQRNQIKYQYVSPAETIVDISGVAAYRDKADPRMWSIFVSIITLEQDEITESITIRI